jgi:hypothetical protein
MLAGLAMGVLMSRLQAPVLPNANGPHEAGRLIAEVWLRGQDLNL